MKDALNTSQPSRLWIARHLAYEAAAKWAKRRPTGLQGVDQKKFIGFTTYCSKKAIVVVSAALTLITLPCATISVLGSIEAEWVSRPSFFGYHFQSIELSPVNVKGLQVATSNVTNGQERRLIQSYWTEAVTHANKNDTKIAMVKSDTVDLLQDSISRNKRNPRDLMIAALVEVLSAGGSDKQALDKARLVLSLGEQVAGAESFLISQFSPVQSCVGIPLFKTLISSIHMTSAPPGPCAGMTWLNKIEGFFMGLIFTILLAIVAHLGFIFTKMFARLAIQKVDENMQKSAGEITAKWEASQVGGAMNSAVSAPSKHTRL